MSLSPGPQFPRLARSPSLLWISYLGCAFWLGPELGQAATAEAIAAHLTPHDPSPALDGSDPSSLNHHASLGPDSEPNPALRPAPSALPASLPNPAAPLTTPQPAIQPELAPPTLSQAPDRPDRLPRSVPPGEDALNEADGLEAAPDLPGSVETEPGTVEADPGLGTELGPTGAAIDPELGILRLQEGETNLRPATALPSEEQYPRFSYGLQGQVGLVYSSNILGGQPSFDDYITQEGLSFTVVPQISRRTAVIAQLGGSWSQYGEFYGLDYRQFYSQVRVRHSLSERVYGEVGWQHQEYFEADGGDRFLKTNTFQASLVHQKPLSPRLDLNNFYQTQWSLSDPSSRNQVVQRLGSGLTYGLRPDLDVGASYNLEVSAFTERDRLDFYNQALAHLTWEFAPRQRLRMFTGFAFGESSVETIQFDGFLFGVSLESGLRF